MAIDPKLLTDETAEIVEASKKSKHKNVLSGRLIGLVISVMLVGAVLCSLSIYNFTVSSLLLEKEAELSSVSALTASNIDYKIPGDYTLLESGEGYRLYKGETDITQMSGLVEDVANCTALEISLVYKDTRILTTITDADGKLATGTGLASQITASIAASERGVYFSNTLINGEGYFSYYYPLYNSDGSYVGSIECCSPRNSILPTARKNIIVFNAIILICTIVLILAISHFFKGVAKSIIKLLSFTQEAASGNDSALLDESLLRRKDEFGTIATAVLDMHRSMRDMMDKDALTKLYNRRSANRKLDMIMSHYTSNGTPYAIAIGDIDFFKKVNDTYGHDGGDVVLQAVATILQTNMKRKGFVARWGGEEFLLAFDKTDLEAATGYLQDILNEIRALTIDYEGREIKITMSFGVACNPELSKDDIICEADKYLYYSKENGRNRITSSIPEENTDNTQDD